MRVVRLSIYYGFKKKMGRWVLLGTTRRVKFGACHCDLQVDLGHISSCVVESFTAPNSIKL